ncbi:carbohydrate ABC transporter permease [Paenibacillus sp. BC26]|uniref:carbohydrate ABC transporter permease n=1 Tax=Paenibacillus sp. BC26 TaxID=1881032 RepID=UPI0008E97161|nr:sugar ABC transporter permease [Paenibacillus sp. BC26]SFT12896.1 carbohydrate ABC transporter membrane protein 1, CUT1 family [Paenibacillus sp. BC26]
MDQKNNRLGWLFTSPYLIYSLIFFFGPLIWSFYLSFTDWDLIAPDYNFLGLKNFTDALKSPGVHAAFWVTYKFMMIFVPLVTVLALCVAVVVHNLPRFKSLFLIGFFLPYLSSGVVSSLIVKGFLSYSSPLNTVLRKAGINIDWLGTPMSALFVVGLILAWKFTGYYALILTSGLNSIDAEIYEAAAIDGITERQRFWRVTLPLLYPAFYTTLILAFGVTFGIFTEVYQLTGGGPNFATNTWQMEIFNQAFKNLKAGYASAVALLASIATFISIFIIRKLLELWGKRYGWD